VDAYEAAAAVRAREVSPFELVQQSLERIEALDHDVNAFTATFPDGALERARVVERAVAAGDPVGRLAGVPISIKDHIWLQGELATNGSRAFADFRPNEDAVPVARIKAAGAVIVGKTNNPEFCYRGYTANEVFGVTRNPWNLDRTPGGSSGGAGACVAASMTPLSIGTDGGGSVRIPASFCGVVGLKQTFGLVPKMPGFRGWPTLSIDGPLARSVRDAALLLEVTARPHPADDLTYPAPNGAYVAAATEERDLSGLRVAWSADLGIAPVEQDVRARFREAVGTFARLGCELVEAHPETGTPVPLWNTIATIEGYASEGPVLERSPELIEAETAEIVRAGAGKTAQLTAFPLGIVSPVEIDGIPIDPFFDDWCVPSYPANLTGQPAISVPCGFGDDGLPVGLQIMARRFDEPTLLAAAAAFERLAPWANEIPPIARQAA
jgi:Asp-tRNA(Asn)/Glu-tRNA(Gln) amidotransferase A subunit family amidase